MSDRVKAAFPRSLDIPIRFMDLFTLRDLARFSIPFTAAIILGTVTPIELVPAAVAGGLIGAVLVAVKVKGEKLDIHASNLFKYLLGTRTKSWPQIEKVDDEVAILDNGTVLGVVQVSSCDLEMLSQPEQRANIATVHDALKTVDFPLEIHSRQRELSLSQHPGQDTAVVTNHYVVIKETPKTGSPLPWKTNEEDKENPAVQIPQRCTTVRNQLTGADLYAEHLTGNDLHEVLNRHHFKNVSLSPRRYQVDNQYEKRRLLYISEFPYNARAGWLADILNKDGLIDVVQTIHPVTKSERDWLSRTASRLTAELSASRNPLNQTELRQAKEDAEDLLEAEIEDETLVNYGVAIIVKADNWTQVNNTLRQVKTRLRSQQVEYREPFLRTHRAVKTDSPFTGDGLQETQIVPGWAAASSFSFNTPDTIQTQGVLAGIDTRSESPVVLNRFNWEAPHTARLGKTGSGKTFQKSLEIQRILDQYPSLHIHLIDPKPDYGPLVDSLDGSTVIIDEGLPDKPLGQLTRYRLSNPGEPGSEKLAETARTIYRHAIHHDGKDIVIVDEAHRVFKHPEGRAALEDLIRQGRAYQIGVDLITQNTADFTDNPEGRKILQNVDCIYFFKHQDLDSGVTDFFHLSPREASTLRKLKTGTQLPFSQALIHGPVNTTVRIEATPEEQAMINQNNDQRQPRTESKNKLPAASNESTENSSENTENRTNTEGDQESNEPNPDFLSVVFLSYGGLTILSSTVVIAHFFNLISFTSLNLPVKLGIIFGQFSVIMMSLIWIWITFEEVQKK